MARLQAALDNGAGRFPGPAAMAGLPELTRCGVEENKEGRPECSMRFVVNADPTIHG